MQLKVSMLGIEEKIMALLLLGLVLNVGSGVSATNECREAGNHGAIGHHGGGGYVLGVEMDASFGIKHSRLRIFPTSVDMVHLGSESASRRDGSLVYTAK